MLNLMMTAALLWTSCAVAAEPYAIVDTGQERCYDDQGEVRFPRPGEAFFGQDAQYAGHAPQYVDHGDGTVTDRVTGLMWQADPGGKVTYEQAVAGAARCRTGGYRDWRLPTIKELYSLIQFSGIDPDPRSTTAAGNRPFIDTRYFGFRYGDPADGERIIDSQWATSTRYVSTTMGGNATMFGVNFADGRIKGYPISDARRREAKTYFAIYVRGNPQYGQNDFVDNGDGTVTDRATGLTWMQVDSGHLAAGPAGNGAMTWEQALQWAENLEYAGHDDWRLPSIKELQSIVDYDRSPATHRSAAIDPVFQTTAVTVEEGQRDFPFFWSSTTHVNTRGGRAAAYIAFGEALGYMNDPRTGRTQLQDVHGAGAQRSDPKSGDPADLPRGHGPQGDVQRIFNYVRCVRGGAAEPVTRGPAVQQTTRQDDREPGGGAGDFVRRLDRDGDDRVSRSEFDGPASHFHDFDRNRDGYITADEAPTGPPPQGRAGHSDRAR